MHKRQFDYKEFFFCFSSLASESLYFTGDCMIAVVEVRPNKGELGKYE